MKRSIWPRIYRGTLILAPLMSVAFLLSALLWLSALNETDTSVFLMDTIGMPFALLPFLPLFLTTAIYQLTGAIPSSMIAGILSYGLSLLICSIATLAISWLLGGRVFDAVIRPQSWREKAQRRSILWLWLPAFMTAALAFWAMMYAMLLKGD